jgi:hypothetical protein
MLKTDLLKLTESQAFKLGLEHCKQGFSVYYNPYRNIDTANNLVVSKIQLNYLNGWMSGQTKYNIS